MGVSFSSNFSLLFVHGYSEGWVGSLNVYFPHRFRRHSTTSQPSGAPEATTQCLNLKKSPPSSLEEVCFTQLILSPP